MAQVRYFAAAQEATGLDQEQRFEATLGELRAAVAAEHPGLGGILPRCAVLVGGGPASRRHALGATSSSTSAALRRRLRSPLDARRRRGQPPRPFQAVVPSASTWRFHTGRSVLIDSMRARQTSNASARCGDDTAITTASSPTASRPMR